MVAMALDPNLVPGFSGSLEDEDDPKTFTTTINVITNNDKECKLIDEYCTYLKVLVKLNP